MIDYQLFPPIAILLSFLLFLGVALLTQIPKRPGTNYLFLLFLSILGWLIFNTFELVDPTRSGTLFWAKVTYIFICTAPVLWLFFILDYFGYKRLLHYPQAVLFWVIPVIGLALVFTNDQHYFFWSSYTFVPLGTYLVFRVGHGPAFFVIWGYAYLLILSGLVTLGKESYNGPKIYQQQTIWIAAGGLIVLVSNLIYISKIFPSWQKDYTPVALAVWVLCFLMAISRHQFIKVAPIRKAVLFEALDDGVIVVDRDRTIVSINQTGQRLLKTSEDEVVGKQFHELFPKNAQIAEAFDHTGEGWREIQLDTSPTQYLSIKSSLIRDTFQYSWGMMLLIRDLTREKQILLAENEERQFALALSEIAAALNSTRNLDDLLDLIIKNVARVTSCDSANIMMIDDGYAHAVRSLEPLKDWVKIPVENTANMKWMVENRKPMVMPDVNDFPEWIKIPETAWIRSYVGAPIVTIDSVIGFINLDSAMPGFYDQKTAERLMALAYHVSIAIQNARIYQQLEDRATKDDLTGIDNRRHFFELATREFNRAQRYQRPLTGIMLDLDHFKRVNDQYGHLAGDAVLKQVAQACLSEIRGIDVLGRYGGEEFAILLTETNQSGGIRVAERIRTKISSLTIELDQGICQITASLGVAELDETCAQLTDLINDCDQAMYQAKKQGRNRVVAHSI